MEQFKSILEKTITCINVTEETLQIDTKEDGTFLFESQKIFGPFLFFSVDKTYGRIYNVQDLVNEKITRVFWDGNTLEFYLDDFNYSKHEISWRILPIKGIKNISNITFSDDRGELLLHLTLANGDECKVLYFKHQNTWKFSELGGQNIFRYKDVLKKLDIPNHPSMRLRLLNEI